MEPAIRTIQLQKPPKIRKTVREDRPDGSLKLKGCPNWRKRTSVEARTAFSGMNCNPVSAIRPFPAVYPAASNPKPRPDAKGSGIMEAG